MGFLKHFSLDILDFLETWYPLDLLESLGSVGFSQTFPSGSAVGRLNVWDLLLISWNFCSLLDECLGQFGYSQFRYY